MTQPPDPAEALAALARRVERLEADVRLQGGLRAMVDRDQANLAERVRVQGTLLTALVEDVRDVKDGLRELTGTVDTMRVEHGQQLSTIVGMLDRLLEGDGA